jgi:large subunit ribosomal protein L5
MASAIKQRYFDEIRPTLIKDFGYSSVMQAPRLEKIVLNIGMGEALENPNALEAASRDVATITGQRPVITRAKKSIAIYKLREGNPIGIKVTLRGERMYDFIDRLCNVALPRQRDFRGISPSAFDGHGNYSLGLREQLVWPEVNYDTIDQVRGMSITIVTSAKTDAEAFRLLQLMGMPFAQE